MPATLTNIQDRLKGDDIAPGSDKERQLLEQARTLKAPDPATVSAHQAELSTTAGDRGILTPEQAQQAGHAAVANLAAGVAAFEPVAESHELLLPAPGSHGSFEPPVPEGDIKVVRLPQRPPAETPPSPPTPSAPLPPIAA